MFEKTPMLKIRRPTSSLEKLPSPTRTSILPIHHLSLSSKRRWDEDKAPTHHKPPLLSLKLSSHSFLDSSIEDDQSAATVYTVKTTDASTTVLRCNGEQDFKIGMIKWLGGISTNAGKYNNSSLLIKMRGHWSNGQAFLRSGSHSDSSRKFTIPGYSNFMKWKRYGTSYWCTTSGVKGPIATLDLAKGQEPIRLAVYETLHDKDDPQALLAYKGVALLLLDYLVVTALLSVTDVADWMPLQKAADMKVAIRNSADSGDQVRYVPEFLDHPYARATGEPCSTPSKISLSSLVSAFPRPTGSFGIGMPKYIESDASSSKWYNEDWSKDYRPLLHNIPPVPPLPPRFSNFPTGPEASTSSPRNEVSPISIYSAPLPQTSGNRNSSSSVSTLTRSPSLCGSQRRPLPTPPTESKVRRIRSTTHLAVKLPRESLRSLPATPVIESLERYSGDGRASVAEGNSRLRIHARALPMTKASQEQWVHVLTKPERLLPPAPSSEAPPSYASIFCA